MSKVMFSILGGFALCTAGMLILGVIFLDLRYPPRSLWDFAPLVVVISALIAAGVGLFFLLRWAAIMISLMALLVASLQITEALNPAPNPQPGTANWLGYVFATLFAIPAILTVLCWHNLVWSNKSRRAEV